MTFCMSCGKEMTEGDTFCMSCGAKQEGAATVPAEKKDAKKGETTKKVESEKAIPAAALTSAAVAETALATAVEKPVELPKVAEETEIVPPVVETATSPATANPPVAAGKKKEKKGLLIGLVIFLVLSTGGSALAYWFYSEIHRDGQSFTDFYLWQAGLKEWKEEKPAVTASDTEETKEGTTTKPVVPPISAPISKPVSTPAVTPAATGVIKDFWYDGNGDIYDVNADQYFLVYTDQEYYYNPTTKKVFLATTTALTPVAVPGFTVFYNAATGLMIALPKGWEKVKVVEETPTGDTAPFEDPVYMKFYLPTTGTAVGSLPGYCATFGIIATSLDSYDTLMADPEASAALNFLGTFGDYGFVETEPDGPFPTDVQVRLTEVPDILSDGISAHEML